jgi:mRNA-degrading endonuclease RelE of RelBE toxin-antitoxin system
VEEERRSHRWLIEWSEQAQQALKKLSSKDRMAVFYSVEHLAKAENPYNVPGVKKLKDPRLEDMRRIRAGDYRIIFWLDTGEIVQLQFSYKGRLTIDGIFIHHKGY